MVVNKPFIVAGIKNLLKKNYGIDPQTVDVEARVDATLDFGENWTIIKEFCLLPDSPVKYFECKHCSKKIIQIKKCPRCKKNYASRVYLEDKTTICIFCHEHQKNMENNVFEPCQFKEGHVMIPKDVPVPATRFDFVQVNMLETRKTEEGETNFIYSYFKDDEGEDCPYWSRPSEYRKCVDNDEECDEAEIFIMSNIFGNSIKKHIKEIKEAEEDEEN